MKKDILKKTGNLVFIIGLLGLILISILEKEQDHCILYVLVFIIWLDVFIQLGIH